MEEEGPVIFFDGVCNLCSGFVRFVAERDGGRFRFSPLQSGYAGEHLEDTEAGDVDSIVVLDGEDVFVESDAVVRILKDLDTPWRFLGTVLGFFPVPLRDLGYRMVAGSRYSVFGRKDVCMRPSGGLEERFVD
jgi:predicted DCC family thiol-disulfide oxidoreductase YuxK